MLQHPRNDDPQGAAPYLVANADVVQGPGLWVAHRRAQGAPLGVRAPSDELDGVERVLQQRLNLRCGHALRMAAEGNSSITGTSLSILALPS